MEMNNKGIIYICIEREFLNNPIYKIGHTQNDDINKYIKGRYPKNTKLVYHRKTNDSKICEKILIKYCDITCHKRKDIGNEYYEGHISYIHRLVDKIIDEGDYVSELNKIEIKHKKYKYKLKLTKKYVDKWRDIVRKRCVFDNCEANEAEETFESWRGSHIGVQKYGNRGQFTLEIGGKKKWFKIPKEFGGGRKNIIKEEKQYCCCKTHITDIYVLENDILVYYCDKRKLYVWRSK